MRVWVRGCGTACELRHVLGRVPQSSGVHTLLLSSRCLSHSEMASYLVLPLLPPWLNPVLVCCLAQARFPILLALNKVRTVRRTPYYSTPHYLPCRYTYSASFSCHVPRRITRHPCSVHRHRISPLPSRAPCSTTSPAPLPLVLATGPPPPTTSLTYGVSCPIIVFRPCRPIWRRRAITSAAYGRPCRTTLPYRCPPPRSGGCARSGGRGGCRTPTEGQTWRRWRVGVAGDQAAGVWGVISWQRRR